MELTVRPLLIKQADHKATLATLLPREVQTSISMSIFT